MKKYRPVFLVACTVVALSLIGYMLLRDAHFPILQPSGDIASQEANLLILAFGLMMLVVVPVFVMLGVFAWKYRAGNTKKQKYTPEWHENNRLELLWWGIPIILIIILGIVSVISTHKLDPYRPIDSDKKALEVQVVALQWKWLFIYPDLGVATVNTLPVPVDTPIHFSLSADAPMSAFWVPDLGSQIYTMNGMSSELNLIADRTGEFPGYNTNINGSGYSDMKFTVYSKTQHDFDNWVKSAYASPHMMDETELARITKPGTMQPTEYMLMDTKLYDKVVMKYMKGMMPSMDGESGNDSHGSHEHDGYNMPTMEGM